MRICIRTRVMRLVSDRAYAYAYGNLYIYGPYALEREVNQSSHSSIQRNIPCCNMGVNHVQHYQTNGDHYRPGTESDITLETYQVSHPPTREPNSNSSVARPGVSSWSTSGSAELPEPVPPALAKPTFTEIFEAPSECHRPPPLADYTATDFNFLQSEASSLRNNWADTASATPKEEEPVVGDRYSSCEAEVGLSYQRYWLSRKTMWFGSPLEDHRNDVFWNFTSWLNTLGPWSHDRTASLISFVGEAGAGKSALVRALLEVVPPSYNSLVWSNSYRTHVLVVEIPRRLRG